MNLPAATAAEIVSAIQREALLHSGLPPLPSPMQSYARERERFQRLAGVASTILPDNGPLAKYRDVQVQGLLARIPTAYQNPFVYAWLEDFWTYHSTVVYREVVPHLHSCWRQRPAESLPRSSGSALTTRRGTPPPTTRPAAGAPYC